MLEETGRKGGLGRSRTVCCIVGATGTLAVGVVGTEYIEGRINNNIHFVPLLVLSDCLLGGYTRQCSGFFS